MSHRFQLRVYYEDTDLAGIVYYANYLKFIERARSEWVRDLGIDQSELRTKQGVIFAVRRIEADYLRPARFGDDLVVSTQPKRATGVRALLAQRVNRGEELLFSAAVTLVAVGASGAPVRLPDALQRIFAASVD